MTRISCKIAIYRARWQQYLFWCTAAPFSGIHLHGKFLCTQDWTANKDSLSAILLFTRGDPKRGRITLFSAELKKVQLLNHCQERQIVHGNNVDTITKLGKIWNEEDGNYDLLWLSKVDGNSSGDILSEYQDLCNMIYKTIGRLSSSLLSHKCKRS